MAQPPQGANSLFDGLKAQVDTAADLAQHNKMIADATARVAALKKRLPELRQRCIILAYLADLHDCRAACVPAVSAYVDALAAAHTARERMLEIMSEAIMQQPGAIEQFRHCPTNLELRKDYTRLDRKLPAIPAEISANGAGVDFALIPRPTTTDWAAEARADLVIAQQRQAGRIA